MPFLPIARVLAPVLCLVALDASLARVAIAESLATYQCGEPRGMRVDYGDLKSLDGSMVRKAEDGPAWEEDGYSGVNPRVAIGGGVMLVSWANAVPESIRGEVDDGATVYRIQIVGSDEISVWGAVQRFSTAEIWRFYLNSNTLYLLQSTIGLHLQDPLTAPSQAAIYIAHCKRL